MKRIWSESSLLLPSFNGYTFPSTKVIHHFPIREYSHVKTGGGGGEGGGGGTSLSDPLLSPPLSLLERSLAFTIFGIQSNG